MYLYRKKYKYKIHQDGVNIVAPSSVSFREKIRNIEQYIYCTVKTYYLFTLGLNSFDLLSLFFI